MKKTLQSIISIMLSIIMIVSVCSVAFAADDEQEPIIVVSGMGCFPLYTESDAGDEIQVWGPSQEIILNAVKSALKKFVKSGDLIGALLEGLYEEMFCYTELNPDGSSVKNVYVPHFDESIDNYPSDFLESERNADEIGIIKSLSKEYGAENIYFFNYDWRLNALDHADDLHAFINSVMDKTGSNKVTLIPCSMGGTVVNSYLYKYGNSNITKIIYTLVASKGLDMVGELFNKNINVTASALIEKLFGMDMSNVLLQVLMTAVDEGLTISGIDKTIDQILAKLLDALKDRAYNELLIKTFGTLPSFWAFSGDSTYEENKTMMFGDDINPVFEKMIDEYHYNVYEKAEELMQDAIDAGIDVYVIAAYGYIGIPVTSKAWEHTDSLIETKNESFGATCAEFGKAFGKNYEPVGSVCSDTSHNHVSIDGIIDASTCAFPEKTWFIKNNSHVGLDCTTDCSGFVNWLVGADNADVFTNESYPQFINLNPVNGEFTSLTGSEIIINTNGTDLYSKIIVIARTIFDILKSFFNSLVLKVSGK